MPRIPFYAILIMITMFVTVPTPSQINVIHTLPNHLFKTHFNIGAWVSVMVKALRH
jgi:uncharacterized membrane protein